MKICAVSDFHGQYEAKRLVIPDADMLIFCGDFTAARSFDELPKFAEWLSKLPHKYKIFVAGNHDWCFEANKSTSVQMLKDNVSNIYYLDNEMIEIEGLKIYGTPIQPEFCNWAFNKNEYARQHYYSLIPTNLDILVTHCPPHGILDWCPNGNVGCPVLKSELYRILPRYHFCGHIHESYGIKEECFGNSIITFVNSSVLDGNYRLVNDPIVLEVK